MIHINILRLTLTLTLLATPPITAQKPLELKEPEKKGGLGGLFDSLKDVVEDVSPDAKDLIEGKGKSLLDRANDLSKSTLEKGKQSFDDLVTSGLGSNSHMTELLAYLDSIHLRK